MLNIGIVGCGWAGTRHAQAILSPALAGRARIAAICDVDPGRLNEKGDAWGVQARETESEQLLARNDVDAVSLCTPHDLHAPGVIAAAQAGKHILVEKPLARTLDEADAMIAAANEAGVVLMVAENVRFNNHFIKARELIDAGYLGDIFLARMSRLEMVHERLAQRPWFLSVERAAGGIMMTGGIHDVEALRMLVGEVKSVYAYQAKKTFRKMEGDDSSVALLEFEDGVAGILMESFAINVLQDSNSIEIHGSLGSLLTDVYRTNLITLYSEKLQNPAGKTGIQIEVPSADTFTTEISHFIDCVEGGKVPITNGEEERRPLAVVLAAYESMATQKRVSVPTG